MDAPMPQKTLLLTTKHTTMPHHRLLRLVSVSLLGFTLVTSSLALAAPPGSHRETPIVVAVRRAKPSVVNISSEKTVASRTNWDGALSDSQRVNGMGSGVVVDERGYIVTNAHVVDKVTSLRVRLSDGTTHEAATIAVDRPTDLALIKIDAGKPLPVIPMGNSSDLEVGETVIAVGNAYGYNDTVTSGLVSAIGRTVRLNEEMTYYDLIQTNADINPGNSGGALLNIDGELIAVNVAIRAGAQGISFAIPVNTVRRVAADMLSIRRINQTWHGLQLEDASAANSAQPEPVVQKIDGPAQKSGFKTGDRVVRVGETPIQNALDFERSLLALRSGSQTTVVVRRGGVEESLQLTIEDFAESPSEMVWRRLGVRLSMTDAYQIQRHVTHLHGGMYVAQVQSGSAAYQAGIRSGDFLLGLHTWETLTYENVLYVLSQNEKSPFNPLDVHVLRNGETYKFQLHLNTAAKDSASKRR
jgi:serine protease Do